MTNQTLSIAQLQSDLSTELKRVFSYKTLVESLESQISHYREKDYKLSEHRLNGLEQSLICEQQMNEILTNENAQLQLDKMKFAKAFLFYGEFDVHRYRIECRYLRRTAYLQLRASAKSELATTATEAIGETK